VGLLGADASAAAAADDAAAAGAAEAFAEAFAAAASASPVAAGLSHAAARTTENKSPRHRTERIVRIAARYAEIVRPAARPRLSWHDLDAVLAHERFYLHVVYRKQNQK